MSTTAPLLEITKLNAYYYTLVTEYEVADSEGVEDLGGKSPKISINNFCHPQPPLIERTDQKIRPDLLTPLDQPQLLRTVELYPITIQKNTVPM